MFFWFKYIFPIQYKIRILDLMLLPKNSVPFEGLYYSTIVLPYVYFDFFSLNVSVNCQSNKGLATTVLLVFKAPEY